MYGMLMNASNFALKDGDIQRLDIEINTPFEFALFSCAVIIFIFSFSFTAFHAA